MLIVADDGGHLFDVDTGVAGAGANGGGVSRPTDTAVGAPRCWEPLVSLPVFTSNSNTRHTRYELTAHPHRDTLLHLLLMPIPQLPSRGRTVEYPTDESLVPSAMPMPPMQSVTVTKNDAYAVPWINDLQRAYIKIVKSDSKNSDGDAFVETVLAGKSFKHVSNNPAADREEEAEMAVVIAKAIAEARVASKNQAASETDRGSDVDAVRTTLRGFPLAGWKKAIIKARGNIQNNSKIKAATAAAKATPKATSTSSSSPATNSVSVINMSDTMRILGLVEYTARQKFTADQNKEILERARTYEGGNAGANFNRAARAMWEELDELAKAKWETAKEAEIQEIAGTPAECMAMLRTALCSSLSKIQESGRVPLFVATVQLGYLDGDKMVFEIGESLPAGSSVVPGFRENNDEEYQRYLGHMHLWANESFASGAKQTSTMEHPVFTLSSEDIDSMSPAEVSSFVSEYLISSYEYVYQTRDIPWADIVAEPSRFFNATRLSLSFMLDDPARLKGYQRVELATVLSQVAGSGTANLFYAVGDDKTEEERHSQQLDKDEAHKTAQEEQECAQLEAVAAAAKERENERLAAEQKARELEAAVVAKERENKRLAAEQKVRDDEERKRLDDVARLAAQQKTLDDVEQRKRLDDEAAKKQHQNSDSAALAAKETEEADGTQKKKNSKPKKARDPPPPRAPSARKRTAPQRLGAEQGESEPSAKRRKP
ncbi:hypothetical protein GGX14DRAFT_573678 [Mycena pura]|uniref:Uncharacterized protein n=1 Tax=Mycena pura TaxID=153505 RepID=A0AAD6Y2K9_9AGAR|nr:hypothetical protein GGX14DRAFT_573678 [Mycena pura]